MSNFDHGKVCEVPYDKFDGSLDQSCSRRREMHIQRDRQAKNEKGRHNMTNKNINLEELLYTCQREKHFLQLSLNHMKEQMHLKDQEYENVMSKHQVSEQFQKHVF